MLVYINIIIIISLVITNQIKEKLQLLMLGVIYLSSEIITNNIYLGLTSIFIYGGGIVVLMMIMIETINIQKEKQIEYKNYTNIWKYLIVIKIMEIGQEQIETQEINNNNYTMIDYTINIENILLFLIIIVIGMISVIVI